MSCAGKRSPASSICWRSRDFLRIFFVFSAHFLSSFSVHFLRMEMLEKIEHLCIIEVVAFNMENIGNMRFYND